MLKQYIKRSDWGVFVWLLNGEHSGWQEIALGYGAFSVPGFIFTRQCH